MGFFEMAPDLNFDVLRAKQRQFTLDLACRHFQQCTARLVSLYRQACNRPGPQRVRVVPLLTGSLVKNPEASAALRLIEGAQHERCWQ
jgi:hypothetical protein